MTTPDLTDATEAMIRDFIIRSVIASQALAGVHVPRDVAERIYDEVAAEPLIDLEADHE